MSRPRRGPDQIRTWRAADLHDLEVRLGLVWEPYPRHWHDEAQVCLTTAGHGFLELGGVRHPTPAGTLFALNAGDVHANGADEVGCSFRSLYLPVDLLRRVAEELGLRGVPAFARPIIAGGAIARRFEELHSTLEAPGRRLAAESLLRDLLAALFARHASAAAAGGERAAVRRVRDALHAAYAENISLEALAALAGLSPYHLARVFRDEVGLPPHAYLTRLRILHARRLLRQGLPPAHVAAATGFVNQAHLSRHFRRLVKLTPGRYLRDSKNVQDPPRRAG